MSRPARWDMGTGRLYRQAAALSGKEIRACVRIAAGSVPRNVIPKGVRLTHGEQLVTDTSHLPGASVPGLFPFPFCGGPSLGHPQSGDRSSSSPPRELTGRQPIQDALRHGVQLLKFTHASLRIGSRRPSSARTGLRDLRNVTAPRRPQQDGRGAFECRSRNF